MIALVGNKPVFGRGSPIFGRRFNLPTSRIIDAKLVGGSAVFGIGGALSAPGTDRWEMFAFAATLVAGIFLARTPQSIATRRSAAAI